MASLFGAVMIVGSIPCTLAGILLWQLTVGIAEGRAAGRDVGFDVIGVMAMSLFALLLALASTVAGLLYFGYVGVKKTVALKAWHWFGIVYSVLQLAMVVIYMSTR